ncbi:uncharacterized protein LOC112511254 isoform X2 [Cynara cardunculus var. scolymus]|uniref:uncharacterized protein LOC112511254 isoform X2 n=1 Tax=Cynara cardunculus var. scolymus TaxID=59895 RepID=UPI000D62BC23|nr:uncharacterized protein LOC112511254 isoform X2 [Cynara cardunculus var. scolymus]
MVAAAICRRLRPSRHRYLLSQSPTSFREFSSSNSDDNHENGTPPSRSQSSSSMSSYFDDVKASLRQTAQPPLPPRRPSLLDSTPRAGDAPTRKVDSHEEIRKHLSEFRRSPVKPPTSSSPTISLQELYKRNVLQQAGPGSSSEDRSNMVPFSLKTISQSLKNQATSSSQSQKPEVPGKRSVIGDAFRHSLKLRPQDLNQQVPESIGKDKKDVLSDEMKTEFVRNYSYGDLGKNLKNLRPEVKGGKKIGFSLGELNERLRKLRELDEEENRNRHGLYMKELRVSLYHLSQDEKKTKPNAAQRLSVLGQIVGTPNFMLSPPKESLVEKYFHPDHMSSSEKQKLQLKEVRDKFKMSESDCGSARVQG